MPTKREREYYQMGFADGRQFESGRGMMGTGFDERLLTSDKGTIRKPKRKLSAWNKFVKANSRKKEFRYANGKLKLKKMGIAFRRKRR
jgi:hypothetical protein